MPKSLVYVCPDHSAVKALVERFGETVTMDQAGELMIPPYSLDGLDYCPTVFCNEGSSRDQQLRRDGGMLNGHKYSIVKEVRDNSRRRR